MTPSPDPLRAAIDSGNAAELLKLVYDELRALAEQRLRREHAEQTLQATALVHEAYLRLIGSERVGEHGWESRAHFFAAAAEAMRRVLVDRARARGAAKRGGGLRRLDLDLCLRVVDEAPGELLDLDEALERLAKEHPDRAELVKLRFFGGLSLPEAARVLGISTSTADRHWAYARAWLFAAIQGRL